MPRLLSVPHRQQLSSGYCLPACVSMVLAYWDVNTPHAVVITGLDESSVWVHDPAKPQSNIQVSIGDFLLAWDVMMNLYVLLRKA